MTLRRRATRLALPLRWLGRAARTTAGPPARAVRGTARVVADPFRQVVAYWLSERETMRQALTANVVSTVTSLLAGVTLALMGGRIAAIPGLFLLIPVSIGMRGNIFGALAARLGTAIHSGLFEVSRDRRGILYQNAYAATLLTIATSVLIGVVARSVAGLIGIAAAPVWDFVVVALVGGLLSSAAVMAFTIYLSITSFRRGWDLDAVGAVLIAGFGDVVTLPLLLAASYVIEVPNLAPAVGIAAVAVAALSIHRGWTEVAPLARRIFRESLPVLVIAIVLDVLAGTVVEARLEHFLTLQVFLVLLPGFLEKTGALGAILAARLGSKLHLGAVTPRARPEAAALLDASVVLALGLCVYALTSVTTLGLAEVLDYGVPGALRFIGVTMLGGIMATTLASLIGYYAAVVTYRFGLDPDNHTIPVVTSGMDLLGGICLVVALVVFGVA